MKNLIISAITALAFVVPLPVFAQSASCMSVPSGLTVGSSGRGVSQLQQFLVSQNYPGSGSWMITGYFGQATAAAVRNFQVIHGLAQTGSVDASTALVISSACSPSYSYAPTLYNQVPVAASANTSWYQTPSTYINSATNWINPIFSPTQTISSYPTTYQDYSGYYGNQQSYSYGYAAAPVITTLSQNTGYPGQSVIIYGEGFDSYNNTVIFNGVSLSNIPSTNGTFLVFTIPSTYYSGSVYSLYGSSVQLSVNTSRGTSNSFNFTLYGNYGCSGASCYCNAYPFSYGATNSYCSPSVNNASSPTISYLSPTSGGIGTLVTVYGSGFTTDSNTVHFGVGVIAGLRSFDGRSVSFTVPASLSGYGTQPLVLTAYPISVINNLGYTTNAVPFSVNSTNNSSSGPVISSVSGPNSLTPGQAGSWSVIVSSGYGQYLTFSADWGDANAYPYASASQQSIAQTNTLTHTYQSAGTYTIRFTASNSYGQSNVYTTTVTVSGSGNGSYGSSVSIFNTSFSPNSISVPRGSTVLWTNNDSVAHTLISVNAYFTSTALYPGQTYQFTFMNPGAYSYYDPSYSQMTGSVYVY